MVFLERLPINLVAKAHQSLSVDVAQYWYKFQNSSIMPLLRSATPTHKSWSLIWALLLTRALPPQVAWAPAKGVKDRKYKDFFDVGQGVTYIPWDKLGASTDLQALADGGWIDPETLPPALKQPQQGGTYWMLCWDLCCSAGARVVLLLLTCVVLLGLVLFCCD